MKAKDSNTVAILDDTNKHILKAVEDMKDILYKLHPRIEEKNENYRKQLA
mgnify:CR=1 FL=1